MSKVLPCGGMGLLCLRRNGSMYQLSGIKSNIPLFAQEDILGAFPQQARNTRHHLDMCLHTYALSMDDAASQCSSDNRQSQYDLLRKCRWFILGILAPELPMLFACGQYASAKRSVDDFHRSGYLKDRWTLCHGFYTDSGGFILQPAKSDPFPITSKQLLFLVQNGYTEMPKTTYKEIQDKSKADGLTKCLAFFQSGWLLSQTIGRVIAGLPVTPLELSTLALASTSLMTLGFWWHKPLDVRTPITIPTIMTIQEIRLENGNQARAPFRDTPLDFVEPNLYMSQKWSQHLFRWICHSGLQDEFLLTRIPNDRDPQATLRQHTLLGVGTAAFASLHLLGWDFAFATDWLEKVWHVSCLVVWILLCVYGSVEMMLCYRDNYSLPGLESGGAYKMRWPQCLLFFVPAIAYLIARICLLVVACCSMASLPEGAYENLQWSSLLPHV